MGRVAHCLAWVVAVALLASPAAVLANINVELRPANQIVLVGQPADMGLWVVSDSNVDQLMSAADIMFSWDTSKLQLTGLSQTGATPLLASSFPQNDPWGVNNANPPTVSPGYYSALANLGGGGTVHATPSGTLLTTFKLTALSLTALTTVSIIPNAGNGGHTVVFDGTTPNLDRTGTLGHADVTIIPEPASLALALLGLGVVGIRRRSSH